MLKCSSRIPGSVRSALATRRARRKQVTLSLVLLALAPTESLGSPVFFGLGDLEGGGFSSEALGVSANGSVVVGRGTSAEGLDAFRWTASEGIAGLEGLSIYSDPYGVSDDGSVVVGITGVGTLSNSGFRWVEGGGAIGFGEGSSALGVSADGSVVVGAVPSQMAGEAFRWTPSSGAVGLGNLPSAATDVSSDGSVVVGSSNYEAFRSEAFRWSQGNGMQLLGDLAGGSFVSHAWGVSGDGLVVVGYSSSEASVASGASDQVEAFRWISETGMQGLGFLPGLSTNSIAFDASAEFVVGFNTSGPDTAFLWDSTHGMRELQAVLIGLGLGAQLSGWNLEAASGISDDGRTIVGWGTNPDGQREAWLAEIPEPSTGWLLGLGLTSLAALRRSNTTI